MDKILDSFALAQRLGRGAVLAQTLVPAAPDTNPGLLYDVRNSANHHNIKFLVHNHLAQSNPGVHKTQLQVWEAVYVAFWKVAGDVVAAEEAERIAQHRSQSSPSLKDDCAKKWASAYSSWVGVVTALMVGYKGNKDANKSFEAWTIPCLYVAGKYLRVFAIKADQMAASVKAGESSALDDSMQAPIPDEGEDTAEAKHLEDAARHINTIFGSCISDRSPVEESRKWALYYTANLLFKTYFRLNSLNLATNILKTVSVGADIPPLSAFPKSHQVTFYYYHGVVRFLSENYQGAEESLTSALRLMPRVTPSSPQAVTKNHYLVLTYLIPTRMMTSQKLPSPALLATNPALSRLFMPVCTAIKRGNLADFDAALDAGWTEFTRRRIYLTLERGRDICLRNVLRKVMLSAGWEEGKEGQVRRSRIRIEEFIAGVRVASRRPDGQAATTLAATNGHAESAEDERDDVECMLANAIYKNFMKGYIARGPAMVVLSKGGAFPGTGV